MKTKDPQAANDTNAVATPLNKSTGAGHHGRRGFLTLPEPATLALLGLALMEVAEVGGSWKGKADRNHRHKLIT